MTTSSARQPDHHDIGLLILSLLGTLTTLSSAVGFTVVAISRSVQGIAAAPGLERWMAIVMAALSLLGLYAVFFSGRRLFRPGSSEISRPSALFFFLWLAFPVGLGVVYLGSEYQLAPDLLVPLGHLLTTAAPVAGVVITARWFGVAISHRRAWGQFLLGVWAAPALALLLEAAALLPLSIFVGLGISSTPEGRRLVQSLLESTRARPDALPEALLQDVLLQPWLLLLISLFLSLIVPLIEEAIKTIGIWPLLNRSLSSAEAFLAGALSGSGYALFEALLLTQPMEGSLPLLVARGGATLMHAFTGAIGTWGIAEGIYRRKWASMALGFLGAVAIHGLWNIAATSISLSEYLHAIEPWNPWRGPAAGAARIGVSVVVGLVGVAIVGLVRFSLHLRRTRESGGNGGQAS